MNYHYLRILIKKLIMYLLDYKTIFQMFVVNLQYFLHIIYVAKAFG